MSAPNRRQVWTRRQHTIDALALLELASHPRRHTSGAFAGEIVDPGEVTRAIAMAQVHATLALSYPARGPQ